ncbi:MAG: type II secretion system protein J [Chthoniobacterales bacterium]
MKHISRRRFGTRGYTVAEMAVAIGVVGLLGGAFFSVLNSGLVLSAKNMAVNTAHQEARQGMLRMTRDIHAAISVPQLRGDSHDAGYSYAGSFPVVSSTPASSTTPVAPTAPGVSFQNIASGPNFVWKDTTDSAKIMIKDNPKPEPGMRLIVPFWGLEEDITKVTAGGSATHSNVFIKSDEQTPAIDVPSYGGTYVITYYTDRAMYLVQGGNYVADSQGPYIQSGGKYVLAGSYAASSTGAYILSQGIYVPYSTGTTQRYDYTITTSAQRYRFENGELHFYKQRYNAGALYWKDMGTVAKYISSPSPFYVPLNSSGTPDLKYVGVQLTARDPKSSNRGYLATASLLNTQIDYRSRLTNTQ